MTKYGYLHSFESFGAVDGPGIRFIVFFSGCPLRCLYCHNPDTWHKEYKFKMSADEITEKILTYKNFIISGGVTLSGGEPLMQAEFCEELIQKCHENSLHVAIDTSGSIPLEKSRKAIESADLILLDIKDIDSDDCKKLTGMTNSNAIKTLEFCEQISKPVWIRHVIVPDYTLKDEKLERLSEFLKGFKCIERVELLPYHTMGKYKWDELGLEYKLDGIEPPTDKQIEHAKSFFKDVFDMIKG